MMTEDEHIQRHIEICQAVYMRLVAEGKWPWPDSTDLADMVESPNRKKEL